MKPTKCRAKEKKRGGEKATRKSEDCSAVSQLENLDILLSAHARTSQADYFASGSEGRKVYDL